MNIADTIAESHTLSRRARPLPIQDSYIFHNNAVSQTFGGRTMIRRGAVDTLLQWSSTDTQGDERDAPGPVSFAAVLHLATEEKGRASEREREKGGGARARRLWCKGNVFSGREDGRPHQQRKHKVDMQANTKTNAREDTHQPVTDGAAHPHYI